MVTGLESPKDGVRMGFTTTLVLVLKNFPMVSTQLVFTFMDDKLKVQKKHVSYSIEIFIFNLYKVCKI